MDEGDAQERGRWRSRLNVHQRVVVVVALGVLMWISWSWLDQQLASYEGGWFTYTSSGQFEISPDGRAYRIDSPLRLLVQAVLIAAWAVTSLWLLRGGPSSDKEA